MKPIILAIDGQKNSKKFIKTLRSVLSCPATRKRIGYIKINDALHMSGLSSPGLVKRIKKILNEHKLNCGIFLDLKLADTNGTDGNVVKHFAAAGIPIDILTVRHDIGAKAFLELRKLLPNTKIAIVSSLTSIPADEVKRSSGMFPEIKILNDCLSVQKEYEKIRWLHPNPKAFDMIVCSPLELPFLIRNFPYQYQYIVPGIRDSWMNSGQQARTTGIKEALNMGATYVVMGSQMINGGPQLSPTGSRLLTLERMKKAKYSYFCEDDPIKMLHYCGGEYQSPIKKGKPTGPLVAYAGKDNKGKNKVGFVYFNFAKAEENPLVLNAYAAMLADKIRKAVHFGTIEMPDVVLGMAMGGVDLSVLVAYHLGVRHAYAVKKEITPADPENNIKAETIMVIERHDIHLKDKVIIIEDVCNNFSTTHKAKTAIQKEGAYLIAIASALNRAKESKWDGKPVFTVCHIPSPQYTQDQKEVKKHIKKRNIVMSPKQEWDTLMNAMEKQT